ncbi:MAG: YbjQ family protein [Candidatus Riflebacteria bacterium]|nr:YbjQ family protein [Candidatus Riflebacteria bacterium]
MEDTLGLIIGIVFSIGAVLLVTVGPLYFWYKVGKHFENKHFADIIEREKKMINIAFTPSDTVDPERQVEAIGMVTGQVVIGSDPFKRKIASLVNLVGGRISVFEAPLDRARREAILRMKEHALNLKADEVVNFRMETMSICGGKSAEPLGIVEVIAYGTAIRYAKS